MQHTRYTSKGVDRMKCIKDKCVKWDGYACRENLLVNKECNVTNTMNACYNEFLHLQRIERIVKGGQDA